jgi:2-iminobutanoate/2-iminopropanoate deaminase
MTGTDISEQTARVLENLQAILTAAGLGWPNVVKTTVYLQRMSDFAAMNEVYTRVMGTARPARSTVEVGALPRGALVEIDLIAALER